MSNMNRRRGRDDADAPLRAWGEGAGRRRHHHRPFDAEDPRGPGRRGGRGRGRGHGGPQGRGGPRRAGRGDVRAAVLLLLKEDAMYGYQLMQTITDRTNGAWRPSAGAIYPTLQQLEDEGMVHTSAEGGRKLVKLTESGRAYVEQNAESWGDPFAFAGSGPDLRGPLRDLHGAARQVQMSGTAAQVAAAEKILADARRALYMILAGDDAADQDTP
ncbi:PadR family transcriptional regulator [Rhodococcus xishaensis]|uniref:PadR family transcriptional regulator n=1 Tax=Rhodococcus xishaensis TaxID=2487364 RepID=A0A438ATU1_9NOCA|nr:PadR family transcriptional regulator [Rhodococcus xishaensis]RVW02116.1 PadR family transcriptional regulator [Rhodococcus xishaensis]